MDIVDLSFASIIISVLLVIVVSILHAKKVLNKDITTPLLWVSFSIFMISILAIGYRFSRRAQ